MLRNQFGFYVGHTGRWAGRGVQVQNLPRPDYSVADRIEELTESVRCNSLPPDVDVSTAITSTIRSSFRAHDGYDLVTSDYASIENRVLAWLADCQPMLKVYCEGRDLYKVFAAALTGHAYADITKAERTLAKPGILGLGYGMSAPRLSEYASSMGTALTEEDAKPHVKLFRESFPEIPALWGMVQKYAFAAVEDHKRYPLGKYLVFSGTDPRFLRIGLPNRSRSVLPRSPD